MGWFLGGTERNNRLNLWQRAFVGLWSDTRKQKSQTILSVSLEGLLYNPKYKRATSHRRNQTANGEVLSRKEIGNRNMVEIGTTFSQRDVSISLHPMTRYRQQHVLPQLVGVSTANVTFEETTAFIFQ